MWKWLKNLFKPNISECVNTIVDTIESRPKSFGIHTKSKPHSHGCVTETIFYDRLTGFKFVKHQVFEDPDLINTSYKAPFEITRSEKRLLIRTIDSWLKSKRNRVDTRIKERFNKKYGVI